MSLSLRREIIPEDILIEILVRLPADSLMRFKLVSRVWSSLISSRYFTNLFFKYSSSTKPKCRVFVHVNHRQLFSSSLCNLDATSSFLQLNPDLTLLGNRIQNGDDFDFSDLHFVNGMRGLMCFRDERGVVRIINFTTRQILILPQVESNILLESANEMVSSSMWDSYDQMGRPYMWNYLGYDYVNDEYKVLSTIGSVKKAKEWRSETQVLVLGVGASWRNTKSLISPPPHHIPIPYGEGISINGVLYYGAVSYEKRSVLMSFDFSSEDFNLIELPMEYRIIWYNKIFAVNLMNYQDQVAVFYAVDFGSNLDVWVLEDAGKSKWSHKVFVLPSDQLRTMLHTRAFGIRGTSCSGEIELCSPYGYRREIKHIIYDVERNHIRRVVAIKPLSIKAGWFSNIWEDVESIMYLEP